MAAKKFPLSIVIGAVDRASGPVARASSKIDRALLRIAAPAIRMQRALAGLGRATGLDRVGTSLRNSAMRAREFGSALGGVVTKLGLFLGAAGAAAATLLHGMATAGDHAIKTSQKLKVGVEWLQEWSYAAQQSGIDQERFGKSLQFLSKNIGDAAAGVGRAGPAFQALGIALKDQTGQTRPLNAVYEEVMEKLASLKDANVRNALAVRLFGEAGLELGPMLATGADGIAALRDRAHELGIVISEEAAKASEEYLDTLDDLKAAAGGARNAFFGAAMPVITEQLQRLTAWIANNRDKLAAWGQILVEKIPNAIAKTKDGLKAFWAATQPVRDLVKDLSDRFGGANVAAVALGVVLLGPAVAAAASLTLALGGLAGNLLRVIGVMATTKIGSFSLAGVLKSLGMTIWTKVLPALWKMTIALAANPLTWIVIGVTAAVAALIYFRKEIVAALKVIGGWVADAAAWIGGWLIWPFEKAWDFIKGFVDWIPEALGGAVDWVAGKFKWLTSWLPDWLGGGGGGDMHVQVDASKVAPSGAAAPPAQNGEVRVNVNFDRMPRGARAEVQTSDGVPFSMNQGYANFTNG